MLVCLLALANKQAERIQFFCTNKSFVISLGGTTFCFLSSCGFNQTIQSKLAKMNTGALSPVLNH